MIRLTFHFFILLLVLSCTSNAQSKLNPNDFEAMLKKEPTAQIVDVRTPEEFKTGFIKGAKNINFYDKDFEQQIAKLDKSKPVMVYCAKGGRSASAAEQLTKAGFPQVFDLDGGMTAWKTAGKKTVQQ